MQRMSEDEDRDKGKVYKPKNTKDHQKTTRSQVRGTEQNQRRKDPNLTTPQSQASSSLNCETVLIHFCHLSHLVCGALFQQP